MSATTRILTVTINPALDLSADVPVLEAGGKLRCRHVRKSPGGGGANVSRMIARLGGESTALVALGGPMGESYRQRLSAEGVDVVAAPVAGETRQNFTVTSEDDGAQYRFVLPGPELSDAEAAAIRNDIVRHGENAAYVVLSGSLPPGAPDDFYLQVVTALAGGPARVVIDVSGPALRAVAASDAGGVYCLRINRREAADIAGRPLAGIDDAVAVARDLVSRRTAENVIVTFGDDGAALASPGGVFHITSPKVAVVSAVGAGDSLIGAFVFALNDGRPIEEACRLGVAAAAGTMTSPGTELCDAETVAAMHRETRIMRLSD